MKSGWADRDAEAIVAEGAKSGIDRDLALRIYTTRLLGRDPKLVLHGGGNTSASCARWAKSATTSLSASNARA